MNSLKRTTAGIVFLLCYLLTTLGFAKDDKASQAKPKIPASDTRSVMDGIFPGLVAVLPLSFDSDKYMAATNRKAILKHLKNIAENSTKLADHTRSMDPSFSYIANNFALDARNIYQLYQLGNYGESRYLLHNLTENCIACHSKMPDTKHVPDTADFFKSVQIAKLSPGEKAQLQVALRQFDPALDTYEQIFVSQGNGTAKIIYTNAVLDYLKVAIRVKGDAHRPIPILEKLSKREDLPSFHRSEILRWKSSLESLTDDLRKDGDELARARKLMDAGKNQMEYPADRRGVVDYIAASSLLNRFINQQNQSKEKLSEAYYLLGVTETLIGRSYWLSQTEFYLETAIRTDPAGAFAQKSYDLLEQQTTFAYSGSAGMHIPEEVAVSLEELRKLIKQASRGR